MNEPLVKLHVEGHVGTIVLNRPRKRNALSRLLLAELKQALDDLHQQRSVRAVVLTGAGHVFCAGMDLTEMQATAELDNAQQLWHQDAVVFHDLLLQMLRFPKPIIASVNGTAVAGGAGLMLACDIVLAAEGAKFGLPEPLRGITAGIVAPLLVFRMGAGYSARLLFTAELIDAAEALRVGLFHEIVAGEELSERTAELALQCARCAPESLQLTKRMLNETIGEPLITQLAAGAAVSATARTTQAAAEGLAAFKEKRVPNWE